MLAGPRASPLPAVHHTTAYEAACLTHHAPGGVLEAPQGEQPGHVSDVPHAPGATNFHIVGQRNSGHSGCNMGSLLILFANSSFAGDAFSTHYAPILLGATKGSSLNAIMFISMPIGRKKNARPRQFKISRLTAHRPLSFLLRSCVISQAPPYTRQNMTYFLLAFIVQRLLLFPHFLQQCSLHRCRLYLFDIAPQFCSFLCMQPDASLSTSQRTSHAHGLFVNEPVARPFEHEGAIKMRTHDNIPKPFKLLKRSPSSCADSLHNADASMHNCNDSHLLPASNHLASLAVVPCHSHGLLRLCLHAHWSTFLPQLAEMGALECARN